MRVTVLAGGHGGARFVRGLREQLGGDEGSSQITVIGNTGDDLILHGLNISPDLDTLMYTLGDGLDEQRGWGRRDEAFRANDELTAYGLPGTWFGLGDRDLATHVVRTQMLAAGYRLSEVTAALCVRWQPGVRLLPMSDDRVETHVVITDDEGRRAIHFQEWWIRYRAGLPPEEFIQIGAEAALPGPDVVAAIHEADVVILPPSNPVVSIGAILSVPGIRSALTRCPAPVVGVSPIIGGRAVRGMAEQCLAGIGVDATATGVARHYGSRRAGGLLDGWLVDSSDREAAVPLSSDGIATEAVPLLMSDVSAAADIAAAVLDLAGTIDR